MVKIKTISVTGEPLRKFLGSDEILEAKRSIRRFFQELDIPKDKVETIWITDFSAYSLEDGVAGRAYREGFEVALYDIYGNKVPSFELKRTIVHEVLHVQYPKLTESEVREKTAEILGEKKPKSITEEIFGGNK